MTRFKIIDRSPRFLPVVLEAQLMSGSFEYALDYLIDHPLELGALDARYRNIHRRNNHKNLFYDRSEIATVRNCVSEKSEKRVFIQLERFT